MSNQLTALFAVACMATAGYAQVEIVIEDVTNEKPYALMVGDTAPALTVGKWIKGQPVEGFGDGTTYVVEFWATWCGPCKKSIPHLTALQQKFADQNVRIVGVSVREKDQSYVAPFVEEWGDKMGYTVAMDSVSGEGKYAKGKMDEGWMRAAGRRGIPSSFIVDGKGRVAWIGHPKELDQPLAQVAAGTWNLEVAAVDYHKSVLAQAKLDKLQDKIQDALQARDFQVALASMDEVIAGDPSVEKSLGTQKFIALLESGQFERAYAYGDRLVTSVYHEEAGALNTIAWTVVDPASALEHRDYEFSIKAAKRACELTEWTDPAILDTLALGLFESGNYTKALKIQEKAVEHAKGTEYEEELTGRLEKFRKAVRDQG